MSTRLRPFTTRREVALKLDAVQDLSVLLEDVTPSMMPDDELREVYGKLHEAWLRFTSLLPHEYEVDPDPQLSFQFESGPMIQGPSRSYVVNVARPVSNTRDND